jgi:hypothetical protein
MIDFGKIFTDTISGILINLPWFILFWAGFRLISVEIRNGVKNIPKWIEQYHKLHRERVLIEKAVSDRRVSF